MKDKIKTIYLNGRFLTRKLTGVERTAYELVKSLDDLLDRQPEAREMNHFVLLYSGNLVQSISLKHIQLVKKGLFKGNLWEQLELPVYTFGSFLVSMCTISSLFKRNQMLFIHDASFAANPGFFPVLLRRWYGFAIPFLGKRIKQLVTVSNFSKSELIRFFNFPSEKIAVLPNAANHLSRIGKPSIDFMAKVDALKPYILAVSSLSKNKNFDTLIKATALTDLKDHHLLIAGGIVATLQQVKPDPRVNYLGYVSDEELKYLYTQASLFVFPSFYEGFGIPPVEAMFLGCPVISSNTSALPEVLGSACLYFDPHSPNDLAIKMQSAIDSDLLREAMRQKGHDLAAQYSWEKSGAEFYHLLMNCTDDEA